MINFLLGLIVGIFLATGVILKMILNGELKYDIIESNGRRLTNYREHIVVPIHRTR